MLRTQPNSKWASPCPHQADSPWREIKTKPTMAQIVASTFRRNSKMLQRHITPGLGWTEAEKQHSCRDLGRGGQEGRKTIKERQQHVQRPWVWLLAHLGAVGRAGLWGCVRKADFYPKRHMRLWKKHEPGRNLRLYSSIYWALTMCSHHSKSQEENSIFFLKEKISVLMEFIF